MPQAVGARAAVGCCMPHVPLTTGPPPSAHWGTPSTARAPHYRPASSPALPPRSRGATPHRPEDVRRWVLRTRRTRMWRTRTHGAMRGFARARDAVRTSATTPSAAEAERRLQQAHVAAGYSCWPGQVACCRPHALYCVANMMYYVATWCAMVQIGVQWRNMILHVMRAWWCAHGWLWVHASGVGACVSAQA